MLRLIRVCFVASHGIYGAPRVFHDLREAGETCSKHRVPRLMRQRRCRILLQQPEKEGTHQETDLEKGELAIADVADDIDAFIERAHSHFDGLSPEQFEAAHKRRR